mmetsp:Transcript_38449/g.85638  ORF Transcript_38449/g.85638 Transcript_38449/m.85638 type:complete len:94 (-) Transcript_38449:261-542(-)
MSVVNKLDLNRFEMLSSQFRLRAKTTCNLNKLEACLKRPDVDDTVLNLQTNIDELQVGRAAPNPDTLLPPPLMLCISVHPQTPHTLVLNQPST